MEKWETTSNERLKETTNKKKKIEYQATKLSAKKIE